MVVIFILGLPLEWPAIVLIFVPIFCRVVQKLDFNLVWFATLVAVNLQTPIFSPPVAMAAHYLMMTSIIFCMSDPALIPSARSSATVG